MAFFDDPNFIISHIRYSFITSDDTGMSELVIVNEDPPPKRILSCGVDSSDSGLESDSVELSQSCDILCDMDIGAHRRRSNTAQRLERLKRERKNQAKIKNVQWRDNPNTLSDEERANLFQKKHSTDREKPSTSLLSHQISLFPALPNNPFSEYAKFDGNAYVGVPTKKINIFLTMLPAAERAYPMPVAVIVSARVQDLVGLVCWQYTNQGKEPKLRESIDYYSLHIAEDDGEVDSDFPCLDTREAISKFGFSMLALVEKPDSAQPEEEQPVVTVHIPNGGFSKIQVETWDITIREILDRTMRRRKGMVKTKYIEYVLERHCEPGVPLDESMTLSACGTLDLCLVRANSKRSPEVADDSSQSLSVVAAPLYQSYRVFVLRGVRPKAEIQLGISGDKVEIDPVQQKGKFWSRPHKAASYSIEAIASCELMDEKNKGKATLRLVCLTANHCFKAYEIEAETGVIKEIITKVNYLLELQPSAARREWQAIRERKLLHRHSFTFGSKLAS